MERIITVSMMIMKKKRGKIDGFIRNVGDRKHYDAGIFNRHDALEFGYDEKINRGAHWRRLFMNGRLGTGSAFRRIRARFITPRAAMRKVPKGGLSGACRRGDGDQPPQPDCRIGGNPGGLRKFKWNMFPARCILKIDG
jgi:hypothetical protein